MKRQVYKLKDTAQTDYTTLDPQNLHLFVDETQDSSGGVVPDASPTVNGISKLYNDLLASNTDGGVTQSAVVTALSTLVEVSNDFIDDTAAAIGGIAVGGLYHTSGIVKIRLS